MTFTLSGAISNFFEAKRAQRLSEHTLSDYGNTFRKFVAYVGEDKDIKRIEPKNIERFLADSGNVSKKTTLNYHTALSSLWAYLVKIGYLEKNIVRQVTPPRPSEKQILPFNRQEVVSFLNTAEEMQCAVRNRALILMLLDTGLRSSEITSLRMRDIDLLRHNLRTVGKGDKERYIPFHKSTQSSLEAYFKFRGLKTYQNRNEIIYTTISGKPMDRNDLYDVVDRISFKAKIQGGHPHRFRHTFAIQFLRNGGNIYTLQSLLGHTQLDMVKRYLAIAQTDLERDHEKASPVKGWDL